MINNLQNINSTGVQSGTNISTAADTAGSLSDIAAAAEAAAASAGAADTANAAAQKDSQNNLSDGKVKDMTDKLNKMAQDMNLQLKFVWYRQLDRLGVKMVDIDTNKTIKSFPPEDVMKALIRTKEWVGKFLDKEI